MVVHTIWVVEIALQVINAKADCKQNLLVYVDDVVVFSRTLKSGVLGPRYMKFFEHMIGSQRVFPDPNGVAAVAD